MCNLFLVATKWKQKWAQDSEDDSTWSGEDETEKRRDHKAGEDTNLRRACSLSDLNEFSSSFRNFVGNTHFRSSGLFLIFCVNTFAVGTILQY